MDRFEELKQKYQGALGTIKREGVRLTHLNLAINAQPLEKVKLAFV